MILRVLAFSVSACWTCCLPDKGLRSLFTKGPKYRLPTRIDFTKYRNIIEESRQWSKKKGVGVHVLNDWKNEFLRIIDIRIDNFTKHQHLYIRYSHPVVQSSH